MSSAMTLTTVPVITRNVIPTEFPSPSKNDSVTEIIIETEYDGVKYKTLIYSSTYKRFDIRFGADWTYTIYRVTKIGGLGRMVAWGKAKTEDRVLKGSQKAYNKFITTDKMTNFKAVARGGLH